jgi:hypothetical protein
MVSETFFSLFLYNTRSCEKERDDKEELRRKRVYANRRHWEGSCAVHLSGYIGVRLAWNLFEQVDFIRSLLTIACSGMWESRTKHSKIRKIFYVEPNGHKLIIKWFRLENESDTVKEENEVWEGYKKSRNPHIHTIT